VCDYIEMGVGITKLQGQTGSKEKHKPQPGSVERKLHCHLLAFSFQLPGATERKKKKKNCRHKPKRAHLCSLLYIKSASFGLSGLFPFFLKLLTVAEQRKWRVETHIIKTEIQHILVLHPTRSIFNTYHNFGKLSKMLT